MCDYPCDNCDNYNEIRCRACLMDDALGYIDAQPTVDAVEVVHGEWTGLISEDLACAEGFGIGMTEEQKIKYLEDFYHRTHCSVCNCCFDDRETKNWNYCPNCGAKMDGGKKDEM